MNRSDHETLQERLLQLEEQAGIKERAEKAREGAFIPYGVFDDPELDPDDPTADNDNYWDHEWDNERRKTRAAYFSVADIALRRELIAARRRIDAGFRKSAYASIQEAEKELTAVERESKSGRAWRAVAMIAATWVILGAVAGRFTRLGLEFGAILGLAIGYFAAQSTQERERARLEGSVNAARDTVKDAKKEFSVTNQIQPEFFSVEEELSGEKDREFDLGCAVANRADFRRSQKQRR